MEAVEQFLRFADLKNLKICQSYRQLRNLQKRCGFPVGVINLAELPDLRGLRS